MFWDAVHFVTRKAGCKLNPLAVRCDFEKTLENASENQIHNGLTAGLLPIFQDLRRKMREPNTD